MNRPPLPSALGAGIAVVLVMLAGSEALFFVPGATNNISVADAAQFGPNGSVSLSSEIRGTYAADVRVTDFLSNPLPGRVTLYYYFDSVYAVSYSDYPDWFGLSQHLEAVAEARGFALNLTLIDAAGLETLLTDPADWNATVILASGVLPGTVFGPGLNLVTPWLDHGGTMIWIGDLIGAYYSTAGVPGGPASGPTYFPNGTGLILQPSLLGGFGEFRSNLIPNLEVYSNPSSDAAAFAIDYPYALFDRGLRTLNLSSDEGTVLGYLDGGYTNIGRISIGNGSLVYFGAPVFDVIRLSYAVLNLLEVGLDKGSVAVLGTQNVSLAANAGVKVVGTYTLGRFPVGGVQVCRVVLEDDYLGTLFNRACFATS